MLPDDPLPAPGQPVTITMPGRQPITGRISSVNQPWLRLQSENGQITSIQLAHISRITTDDDDAA